MKERIVTGGIFAVVLLALVFIGESIFNTAFLIITVLGLSELIKMTKKHENLRIAGVLYVVCGFLAFIGIRGESLSVALWIIVTIWLTDSAAYFVGKYYGRHKLAPKISPKKTWEGSIGGLVAGILTTIAFIHWLDYSFGYALFLGVLISVVGQIGDLVESFVKRRCGVKDSGNLLPGHGGILDRFDSLLLVSIVFVFVL
jgi:phosphatidate cytidylyltransferase